MIIEKTTIRYSNEELRQFWLEAYSFDETEARARQAASGVIQRIYENRNTLYSDSRDDGISVFLAYLGIDISRR